MKRFLFFILIPFNAFAQQDTVPISIYNPNGKTVAEFTGEPAAYLKLNGNNNGNNFQWGITMGAVFFSGRRNGTNSFASNTAVKGYYAGDGIQEHYGVGVITGNAAGTAMNRLLINWDGHTSIGYNVNHSNEADFKARFNVFGTGTNTNTPTMYLYDSNKALMHQFLDNGTAIHKRLKLNGITDAQMNLIPAEEGLIIYNLQQHKYLFYNGSSWATLFQ